MRPRRELGLVVAIVLVLLIAVARVGSERNREPSLDPRRSTYLTAPAGAHGFAAALERLGVGVVRLRQRLPRLDQDELSGDARDAATTFAVIGPTFPLDAPDATTLAQLSAAGVDLLLAGGETQAAMRCFGYRVRPKLRAEQATSVEPGAPSYTLEVHAVLRPVRAAAGTAPADSVPCPAPLVARVDTLLRTGDGQPAALRLELASGARATLVADDEIFSNRVLRASTAAPFVLRLVAGRYERMLVDEYDHGFGPSGRLDQAVVAWIKQTPWGWAGLQLAGVGLLALFASGARFGPVRRVIERRRRSPLEHVRALATALAAARGHGVAVGLLVRGLQRRLARGSPAGGAADRLDPAAWLAATAPRLRTAPGRAAADRLRVLMQHPVSTAGVLEAAELVETIWTDLTSASSPAMSSARRA
ncbi:MAG: DUF4350 domain-containing protein [Gemmatimonadales bacterium]